MGVRRRGGKGGAADEARHSVTLSFCYWHPTHFIAVQVDKHVRTSRYATSNGTCAPEMVRQWMLMHFPCAGEAQNKAEMMQRYLSSESCHAMSVCVHCCE